MTCDILVIGGGLSGLMCAEAAAKEGLSVLLIADGAGASPYIHGINLPLGAGDSTDLFVEDTLHSGKYQNDKELVRVLCEGAAPLGERYPFDRDAHGGFSLLRPLGASVPRVAGIESRTGAYLMAKIRASARFEERGHTRALRLEKDGERVIGALAFDTERRVFFHIRARATVLATGGFCGIFPFSTNSSDIGGDGIAMAYLAGAPLCDMEFIQYEPTAARSPAPLVGKSVITTMLFEGACFRNARGETFLGEPCADKDALSKAICREILAGGGTPRGGVWYDATGVGKETLLHKYRTYYDRYARVGVDISREPMEVAPAPHTSLGGIAVRRDTSCGVPGLFACGEVTGGLHGANRMGGNAGLEVLVFGKIAGENAAMYAKSAPRPQENDEIVPDTPTDFGALKTRIGEIAASGLAVVRDDKTMARAEEQIEKILDATKEGALSYERMRRYNDALTVRLCLCAARGRGGSLGTHERADGVPEDGRYTQILRRGCPTERKER